jgi:cytochrome c oxidase cbb3-type subunit I/II
MYYFIPKAAIVQYILIDCLLFTLVVNIFIHLGRTTPFIIFCIANWAQNLVVFSIMLLAPSLGGMINGLLTLRGAWDKVRVDPVLKFFVCDYWLWNGHFEGPMLSSKM